MIEYYEPAIERHPTTSACREAFRDVVRRPDDQGAKMVLASELEACGRRRLAAALRYAALNRIEPHGTNWQGLGMDKVLYEWVANRVFKGRHDKTMFTAYRAYVRLLMALEANGLVPQAVISASTCEASAQSAGAVATPPTGTPPPPPPTPPQPVHHLVQVALVPWSGAPHIGLVRVAGDDDLGVLTQSGEDQQDLRKRGILRLVKNDHGLVVRNPAGEPDGLVPDEFGREAEGDLLQGLAHRLGVRGQLVAQVAGQEAQVPVGLDRRPEDHDLLPGAAGEDVHGGHADGLVGLSAPSRPHEEQNVGLLVQPLGQRLGQGAGLEASDRVGSGGFRHGGDVSPKSFVRSHVRQCVAAGA